jgi:hypothetical protein
MEEAGGGTFANENTSSGNVGATPNGEALGTSEKYAGAPGTDGGAADVKALGRSGASVSEDGIELNSVSVNGEVEERFAAENPGTPGKVNNSVPEGYVRAVPGELAFC